jgi:hypothetical protein
MVLSGIGDQDRHLRVLVEDLLNAAVVNTLTHVSLARFLSSIFTGVIVVAKVLLLRQEGGWILSR